MRTEGRFPEWTCQSCWCHRNWASRLCCLDCGQQRPHPSRQQPADKPQNQAPTHRTQPTVRVQAAAPQGPSTTQQQEGPASTESTDTLEQRVISLKGMIAQATKAGMTKYVAEMEQDLKALQMELLDKKPLRARIQGCLSRQQQKEKDINTLTEAIEQLDQARAAKAKELEDARLALAEQVSELDRLRALELAENPDTSRNRLDQTVQALLGTGIDMNQILEMVTAFATAASAPVRGTKRQAANPAEDDRHMDLDADLPDPTQMDPLTQLMGGRTGTQLTAPPREREATAGLLTPLAAGEDPMGR